VPTASQVQDDIAIVGMACRFAGAADPAAYWRNIVACRSAIGDHPHPAAGRVLDAHARRFDRLRTLRGGYLRDLNAFQPGRFGLAAEALAGANPDQFLALQIASEALQDAGLQPRTVPAGRTALFFGYAAPVNPASANWLQHGLAVEQTAALLQRLVPSAAEAPLDEARRAMNAALPPVRPAALRSAFGHGIAGRCAASLGLSGAALTVDAGAASSLAALRLAMDDLRLGRCDVALAGAVQTCSSVQVLMGLASLYDFTGRELPCPFGRDADGTLPGEGGAFLVLKRRRDAERNRDAVYALLTGVGLAAADETALGPRPAPESLAAAMRAAYDEAGAESGSVALVEGHGSGVPREDLVEIQALRQVFGDRAGAAPRVLAGSVKTQIGHCFAAAGAAGVVKAALALHHRVLPPMLAGPGRLHPRLVAAPSPFYVASAPRPWVHGRGLPPRRAAVTACDGACLYAHAVLAERPEPR